ncbi:MAG: class I SAM-dependent RNA methyltransferase [Caulobacteraceae bacterium]|nr:class I SAM-dependent RNA methyltransferase [Caulobacteraceae bacterium]
MRELAVDRVGAQGDGVGEGIFVAGALPGERVRARVAGDRGELAEVLQPSPERQAAPCPHFGDCGGCALQHWRPEPYLAWKADQIRFALARERIETEILAPFAPPPGSRRRLALHARARSPDAAALGFKARRSWRLVPIEVCPVADPRLEAALPALRRLAAPLFEAPKSAPILHVTLTETGLDVDVTGVERRAGALSADARQRVAERAAQADLARVTLDGEILYQARSPAIRIGRADVALPPGAFLQAVAAAEAAMAAFVSEALVGAERICDLYCGVGAFALRLAERAPVTAADISAPAVRALTSAQGTAPGLKAIAAEARDLVRRPLVVQELRRFDAAVIDPPRAGAPEQHRQLAASGVSRIAGVSCNPATFARDARILVDAGFTLEQVLPVDQFLWSPHIELVGLFSRRKG